MARFNIEPMPKPRMTQGDRWNNRPAVTRYWSFKDELQRQASLQGFKLDDALKVVFYVPMPHSWSRAKKMRMVDKPHRQKPDIDNFIKAVLDSLLPDGDSSVWYVEACKLWALEGGIVIENIGANYG